MDKGWRLELVKRGLLVATYQAYAREGLVDYVRGWIRPANLDGPITATFKGPGGAIEHHRIEPERGFGRLRVPRASEPRKQAATMKEPELDRIPLDGSGWYSVKKN